MNRGILGGIISRFENKGYKLVGIKTLVPTKQLAEEHYAALSAKPFFKDLVDFITSGPMIGETNPLSSAPGTIRGDYAVDVGRK
ncbi:nucleoside-diphosphate kinase [Gracilaria domingensis]|nr:nucleoside-diphosphate kinase [Gracilaria domingensis]